MGFKIKWIVNEHESYEFNEFESAVLFSYLVRYEGFVSNIWKGEQLYVEGNEALNKFIFFIELAIDDIIANCWNKEKIVKQTKYIEKFEYKGSIYRVNYVTDRIGHLIYTLYLMQKKLRSLKLPNLVLECV